MYSIVLGSESEDGSMLNSLWELRADDYAKIVAFYTEKLGKPVEVLMAPGTKDVIVGAAEGRYVIGEDL